jgi:hypothetical protein
MTDTDTSCFRPRSAAEIRYTRRVVITMSAYVAVLFGSVSLLRGAAADWPTIAKALLALAPVLPVAWLGKALVAYLGECDEMIRRIELEAIGLASLIVGLLFLSVGFLIQAGVFTMGGGTVAIWVFPMLCGVYGLTKWQAVRRYR